MSDLRIRSEAGRDAVWPQAFLPPQARAEDHFGDRGEADFAPLLQGCSTALALLFGAPVTVLPGQPVRDGPSVAADLAGLLATVRMGGDPLRPAPAGGVAPVRYAGVIAAALDAVAAQQWPVASRASGYDLDIRCGATSGHANVAAPPPVIRPLALPAPGPQLDDLPLRLRVELASDMVLVSHLLPLRAGIVLPINPGPEMPLIIGDHRIGRATVAPLTDGRQQATIVAIGVEHRESRP